MPMMAPIMVASDRAMDDVMVLLRVISDPERAREALDKLTAQQNEIREEMKALEARRSEIDAAEAELEEHDKEIASADQELAKRLAETDAYGTKLAAIEQDLQRQRHEVDQARIDNENSFVKRHAALNDQADNLNAFKKELTDRAADLSERETRLAQRETIVRQAEEAHEKRRRELLEAVGKVA